MLSRLRDRWQRWRVRRRRHKLVMAYAKVGEHRHELGSLSSLMYAYGRVDDEGLADLTEDGFDWHWPDEGPEVTDVE